MKSWAQFLVSVALGLIFFSGVFYLGHLVFVPTLPLVGVIQWTREIKTFEDSLQGVIEGLREEGYQEGLNIRLKVINARADREETAAAVREIMRQGARLLITVGTMPTLMALEMTGDSNTPIVYTNVGYPNITDFCSPVPAPSGRITGTSVAVPIQEQLRYLLLARPGLKRLGILYCHVTPQAVATAQSAAEAASKLGLTPIRHTVTDDRPELLRGALNDLLAENLDALFIPTDPVLRKPRNLEIICQATSRARVPVMVPDGASVAYGPLLSYHCDFVQVGYQSGRQAAQILKGAPLSQVPPQTPKIKKLTINLKAAQDLNLKLPRQLLAQANQFHQ